MLMRNVIALGVAIGLSGCVTPRDAAQKAALARWDACVTTVFVANFKAGQEKNTAVENAFAACKTEENAVLNRYLADPEFYLAAVASFNTRKFSAKQGFMAIQ